jgi:N utilization substance protein A
MVVSELRGEKIDIIPFNEEPARFVAKALSPARVREVLVDDENKQATVIVPDDQLSLAIGKEGQNARLAARLTGWRVDIRSETEFAEEESEMGYQEEETAGRCAAIMRRGNRCPNASLPGAIYCGLPTHQALKRFKNPHVAILDGLPEDDISKLAGEAPDGEVAALVSEVEARAAEAPPVEEPAAEEPVAEEPAVEETAPEEPAAEEPAAEETAAQEPVAEESSEAPVVEAEEEGADEEVAAAADEQEES